MQRANFDPAYFRKFLWISLACLAGIGWCLYDAQVKYPATQRVSLTYEAIKSELTEKGQGSKVGMNWRKIARKNGWSTEVPAKTSEEIAQDIGKQYFMAIICVLFGLPCFVKWWRAKSTWVEGDEKIIRNSQGQEVLISEITRIDKRKWDEKGIAYIHHTRDGEKQKKFLMDDYKFDPEVMGELMMHAEANLTAEQITGGKSERQKIKDKEQAESDRAEKRAEKEAAMKAENESDESVAPGEPDGSSGS